ncbi:MAG: phenylalanine--tRNA ligase subunit alpha [Oligoflexales bacterium]
MIQQMIENLKKEFQSEAKALEENPSARGMEDLRVHWLGRKGKVTGLYSQMKSLSKEERPQAGQLLNELKSGVELRLKELKDVVNAYLVADKLKNFRVDISRPVESLEGSLHPVTLMQNRLLEQFRRHGFSVVDGPELDTDFYNFSALNIPADHPSRDMNDTFYLKNTEHLLRTQTSNIQIHTMSNRQPPLRIVSAGRVFRVDSDATHTPMFHQIEGLVVDRGISFAHLRGMIDSFVKGIFGNNVVTRLRASYFPFVEPGAEMDIQCQLCKGKGCRVCSQTGWLEVGGCGMVHPNVFEAVQYDSEELTGFAFGFGIDRLAMLAWALPDLRQMFEGDVSFQKQFPIVTH